MTLANMYIPERFSYTIAAHIVMNLLELPNLHVPLLLGIHGPPGEGKTEQCRSIFENMGVKAEWVTADSFESYKAGEPIAELRKKYFESSNYNLIIKKEYMDTGIIQAMYKYSVLFINDIDQRIGRSDDLIQQTINTQLINAFLMEMADIPKEIEGRQVSRVPIIVTGNDFSTIYGPLRRDGRMDKFKWIPSIEEKSDIVRKIFPEATISNTEIKSIVSDFSFNNNKHNPIQNENSNDLPVSSYATIRYRIYKKTVIALLKETGLRNAISNVYSGYFQTNLPPMLFTASNIRGEIVELIGENNQLNHLRR